ncbi:MAG: hypothetical protein QM813_05545 [Verrucomicrobiota bacterium]
MKTNACRALLLICLLANAITLTAQTFVGTNAPGGGTNYSFTLSAAATNLSLVISNGSTTVPYLLLAKGRTPTDTDFDFISRINGATNQINLQSPEFAATNYGLRVLTPATSTTHAFTVTLTTNRYRHEATGVSCLEAANFYDNRRDYQFRGRRSISLFSGGCANEHSRLAGGAEYHECECRSLCAARRASDDRRLFAC